MPKFLDAPSWYDEYGKENLSIGAQTISVDAGTTVDISSLSAGIYKLKYVGDYIQSGTVTFALSSSLSITAQFMAAFQMDAFNNSWFELGEANLSIGTNVWARMLTFHNMCISSNYSDSVSNNMTISPTIGRSFTLQLNYMNSVSNMYAATVVDAGFSITLPGVTSTQSSRSIYAPTVSGTAGQYLQSGGSGEAPSWVDLNISSPTIFKMGSGSSLMLSTIVPSTGGFGIVWCANNDDTVSIKSVSYKGFVFVYKVQVTSMDNWYWCGVESSGNLNQNSSNSSISITSSGNMLYYISFPNRNG